jgi:outer membrane protein assembly factor BamB
MPHRPSIHEGAPCREPIPARTATWRTAVRAVLWGLPLIGALGAALPVHAQTPAPTETRKLRPADGAANDRFGSAVALDGTRALVGAIFDDDSATDAGSAYLYDIQTGALLRKLLAGGPVTEVFGFERDFFGHAVALRGSLAVVGAANSSAAGMSSGALYIFDADTGAQRAKLLPFATRRNELPSGGQMGFSVALSNNRIVTGAPGDSARADGAGAMYLYDASTLALVAKVFAADAGTADNFARVVAASGDVAVASSMFDDDLGTDAGAVYVFDAVSGQQRFKLRAADGAAQDLFGLSLAAHGSLLAVGAPFDDDLGDGSGAVYLFDSTTGQQLAKFTPADGAAGDRFGWSVGLTATHLVVGTPLDDDAAADAGAVYVFDLRTGAQVAKFRAGDARAGDSIAGVLAITGTTVLAGAARDDETAVDAGAAYVFTIGGGAAPQTLRVASIEPGAVPDGNRQRARVAVTIVDDLGNPVQGATVIVTLTGAITETLGGLTNASGVATVTSTQSVRVPRGGTLSYEACVTSVTGPLPHDRGADSETCDSR